MYIYLTTNVCQFFIEDTQLASRVYFTLFKLKITVHWSCKVGQQFWGCKGPVSPSWQGWEFAHLLICSFAHFSHSLILLKSNEQLLAICSDRSRQMSDREQIAQVPQDKWATISDLLRLLRGNERMSNLLNKFWLNKFKILFLVCFIHDLKKIVLKKWANCSFPLFWWAM